MFAIAAGVAAVGAVRAVASEMRSKVRADAREWIAADLYVRLDDLPSDEETSALAQQLRQGVEETRVTEIHGIVTSSQVPDPALAFIKVVDPARYPFYGTVELRPSLLLRQALQADSVVVSSNLAEDMKLKPGDSIRLGNAKFLVAALIIAEPDWSGRLSSILPRVMLTPEAFERSGLALQGDVVHKLLFRIPEGSLEATRRQLEKIFPDDEIVDYRDPDPGTAFTIDEAAVYFLVAAWLALAVGSLAVALIMHLHLQQRTAAVAVMKTVGARGGQILAIYTVQSFLLALGGGIIGAATAFPLERLATGLLPHFLPVHLSAHWSWTLVPEGIAAGMLAVVPSLVITIGRLRVVSPGSLFRRRVAAGAWKAPMGIPAFRFLPLPLRLAARNIVRPGNHSAAMALALSGGVAMLYATYACQREIVEKVAQTVPSRGSDLYLISTGRLQLNQATDWLARQPGVEGPPEVFPLIALRLDRINGASPDYRVIPRMWLTTCSDDKAHGEIVPSSTSSAMHVKSGDWLEFSSRGRTIRRRVASRVSDADAIISLLTVPCSDFDGLPVYYHAAVRVKSGWEAAIRRALAARYPGLPTLSRAEFTALVRKTAGDTGMLVRLISWAVVGIGLCLEVLLIAAGKRLRMEEVALAKVLGARQMLLLSVFVYEFGLLGLFSALLGCTLGTVLASLALSDILHQSTIPFHAGDVLLAAAFTALFAAAAGGLAGAGVVRRKPLEILREA